MRTWIGMMTLALVGAATGCGRRVTSAEAAATKDACTEYIAARTHESNAATACMNDQGIVSSDAGSTNVPRTSQLFTQEQCESDFAGCTDADLAKIHASASCFAQLE